MDSSSGTEKPPVPKNKPRLKQEDKPRLSFALIAKLERLFKETINEYRNQLDVFMNEIDVSITEIELIKSNEIVLEQIISDFKRECGIYDDQFLNDNYITRLKNEMNVIFEEFKVNVLNRDDKQTSNDQDKSQENLSDEIKQIYSKYFQIYENNMKQTIVYPINWSSMEKRHLMVRSQLIGQFVVKERGFDVMAFSNWLDSGFNEFKIKISNNLVEMDNYIKRATFDYIHAMQKHFPNESTFYENEKLNQIHKNESDSILAKLEQGDSESISETNELRKKLVAAINQEFRKYSILNKSAENDFNKVLVEKVQALIGIYENRIYELTNQLKDQEQLSQENESLKKELSENFRETNSSLIPDTLDYYLKELDQKMNQSYEDAENVLKISLENRFLEQQRIDTEIREKYKQNMKIKFEIRPFYLIRTLKDFHQTFTEELSQTYNKSIDTISELVNDIFSEFDEFNARNTPNEPAIGIDLGTTNSCVAYYIPGLRRAKSTVVIHNEMGRDITPSVVSFRPKNVIEIGDKAKDERDVWPLNTIYSVKRLIGQTYTELDKINIKKQFLDHIDYTLINVENKPKICVKVDKIEKQYYPEDISAMILKKLKSIAEKNYLNGFNVKKAVITVPAYFSSAQKEATKQAGMDAGLEVLSIINEPTAAAIAYKTDMESVKSKRSLLIYDFGGGTFDVAIVRMEKGEIIIKAVNGDNYLGGDDIDNNLVNYCIEKFLSETGLKLTKNELKFQINRLRKYCEDCKIRLSKVPESNIRITNFYEDFDLNIIVTRHKFEEINKDIFKRSIDLVDQTLKEIKMSYSKIDDIVLVGGTTRIPKIREMLSKFFKKKELIETINPDLSVAIGAAIHAATLNGQLAQQNLFKFTDVTAMSLGLENAYKEIVKLIPRNTLLPTKQNKTFKTSKDNQTSVMFSIYEGEDRLAQNNNMIGNFELQNIPSGKKGQFKIDVTFEMNAEGILTVSAKCDQAESTLQIKKHNILYNDDDVVQLLNKDSSPIKIKEAGKSGVTETNRNEPSKNVLTDDIDHDSKFYS